MRNTSKMAANLAAASAVALILTTSAFAETRHRDETWRERSGQAVERTNPNHQGSGQVGAPQPSASIEGDRAARIRRDDSRSSADRDRQASVNGTSEGRSIDARSNGARSYEGSARRDGENRSWRDTQPRDTQSYDRSSASRGSQSYDRSRQHAREPYRNGELRSDGRISTLGHVRSYTRERDGYRVYLDRGNYSYWVPESHFRGHRLAVGLELRLGGIFHGGLINVDVLGWPGDPYYNDPYYNEGYGNDSYYNGSYGTRSQGGYLRGVVDRVDFRSGSLWMIDEGSRRLVTVDMRSIDRRYSRLDLSDLRRGDRIALTGDWVRGGLFDALRIDSIDAY